MAVVEIPEGVKLKTCPFCGAGANLRTQPSQYGIRGVFWVKCSDADCGVSTRSEHEELSAIRHWNDRKK